MLTQPRCEICGQDDWKELRRRRYEANEIAESSAYHQKRFRVLFEKWFPAQDSITLTSVMCRKCGFIIYLPRPEERDIDAKYQYLEELGQDYGESNDPGSEIEKARSIGLLQYIGNSIDLAQVSRVLDYGGGDGRLMRSFRENGKQCYLIDYNQSPTSHVERLGNTIFDIEPETRFDLIVCSHVIEHIAQPMKTLEKLRSHLSDGGSIFIEVPMEVWKEAPLACEPVTHINFFTPNSLHNLLHAGGFSVLRCELMGCLHPSGTKHHGIRAIGEKLRSVDPPPGDGLLAPDGSEWIRPDLIHKLRYHLCTPGKVPARILRSVKRLWPSVPGR